MALGARLDDRSRRPRVDRLAQRRTGSPGRSTSGRDATGTVRLVDIDESNLAGGAPGAGGAAPGRLRGRQRAVDRRGPHLPTRRAGTAPSTTATSASASSCWPTSTIPGHELYPRYHGWYLWRLLIGAAHQRRGYGTQVIRLVCQSHRRRRADRAALTIELERRGRRTGAVLPPARLRADRRGRRRRDRRRASRWPAGRTHPATSPDRSRVAVRRAMCGRFVSASTPEQIAAYFDAEPPETELNPSYNVAPTTDVYAVVEGAGRQPAGRGVPLGAHPGLGQGHQDRPEDDQRPRRDAGHEGRVQGRLQASTGASSRWTASTSGTPCPTGRRSSPTSSTGSTASRWPSPACGRPGGTGRRRARPGRADWLHSCTVVTTSANDTMAAIHDRMPVILPRVGLGDVARPRRTRTSTRSGSSSCPAPERLLTCTPSRPT